MRLPNLNLFQRDFVSIVITPNRVLVVKVNKRNKAEIFAQKNIPLGVIKNYRVNDQKILIEVISSLWKEAKIKDKFVGVVVPEFATYTKTLELPSLSDAEIKEALNWQLQEYLPAPIEDLVVDWKLIDATEKKAKILVVAILKDVLMGYIDAVGQAGLSPLVVETPSLSVTRLSLAEPSGKLIIYVSSSEALLVMANGTQIVASSVVSADNLNIVVSTGQQMISYYQDVEVSTVLVAGVGVSQDLLSTLHYNLGRTVSFLNYSVEGMAPPQVQDYLLGISLQHKDPAEPASDKTINLLPPLWAETYRSKLKLIKAWTLTLIISILSWATFLSIFAVSITLTFQQESLQRETESLDQLEYNQVLSEIKNINTDVENILAIDSSIIPFEEVINLVYSYKPDNVTLTNIYVNYGNGAVNINGTTTDYQSLSAFHAKLNSDSNFQQIVLPVISPQETYKIEFTTTYLPFLQPVKKAPPKLKL